MRSIITASAIAIFAALTAGSLRAQEEEGQTFGRASQSVIEEMKKATEELSRLETEISEKKLELTTERLRLEKTLVEVKNEDREAALAVGTGVGELDDLRGKIKKREAEVTFLRNFLEEFAADFKNNLQVAERSLYEEPVKTAALALENPKLSAREIFGAQAALFETGVARLEALSGGHAFTGSAIGPDGVLQEGTFTLIGPAAFFRSAKGDLIGTVKKNPGGEQAVVEVYARPEDKERALAAGGAALMVDSTLGKAHKVAAIEETTLDQIKKGGPVMYPILGMAGLALLIALFKFLAFLFVRKPGRKQMTRLIEAVGEGDASEARSIASRMRGSIGRMLFAGTRHIDQPRDLIEEVMYEHVLTARMRLNRMLPFIAICAASAPLLGLLGTVSGIINTFKQITLEGSGDVQSLSGGISEALITTKWGLIVAIPSLLLHAFLSRKAKGMMGKMESAAVAFANAVSTSPLRHQERDPRLDTDGGQGGGGGNPDRSEVREQVSDVLRDMLGGGPKASAQSEAKTMTRPIEPGAAGEAHA